MTECLHELIEAHASARPDAVAIDGPQRTVTYRELDGAANHVAQELLRTGLRPDGIVAVYGRVGPELLTGMIGVLKAGGAFLPLDPTDPLERTKTILAAAGPGALLTVPEWSARAERLGPPTIVLTEDRAAPRPEVRVGRDNAAYVLFTSGSTGRPKGVVVEHHSIVNYCRWVATANRVDGRVAPLPAVTRFVFDASLQQLLAPLVRGDAVWLVPDETRTDPELLLHTLRSRPGAGLHCVPALWEEVLLLLENEGFAPLELASLFLGGDVVRDDLWERTRRMLPRTACANVYGPTETTVQATGGFQLPGVPLTVGRPVHGAVIDIRDADGGPVRPGHEGEVHIGGRGVARGYLGRPELTAERFVGGYYRTGDAGVLLPDGSLRLLGRLDDQIKLRGHRIEPGEIEAVLAAHPDVRSTVVIGAHGLCAAVTATGNNPRLLDELREEAERRLPEYMLPDRWSVLAELPLTANGKVDRRRVAEEFAEIARGGRPPRTATELLVAGVWQQVLEREVTSADDDFFELGGHSLLAMRVAARLRKAIGTKSALPLLFDRRTVAGLAAALDAEAGVEPEVEPEPVPSGGPAPLSLQQQAVWANQVALPDLPFTTMLIPVAVTGALDPAALAVALRDLVAAQPSLRTRIVDAEQTVAPAEHVELSVLDLRTAPRQRARKVATELYLRPFDLADGTVLRTTLLWLADEDWVLLLCLPHLFCDGVSVQIMLEDLATAYEARAQGKDSPLAPSPHYGEFARAQRREVELGRFAADVGYWRAKTALPPAELGLDGGGFRYGTRRVTLASNLCDRLRGFAGVAGATPFMCLTASIAALFRLSHGVDVLTLGTLAANREQAEYERVVGLFATTLLLRVDVSGPADYHDLVARVRTEMLASFAHQRAPLELAVTDDRSPFQVGISWEPARPPRMAGDARFELYSADDDSSVLPVMPSSTAVTFTVRELAAGYRITCEYNESALSADDADDLLDGLVDLVARQLADPAVPLTDLAVREVAQ